MKLLLDTTYLLLAIGISIKGLPNDVLIKLLKKGHKIFKNVFAKTKIQNFINKAKQKTERKQLTPSLSAPNSYVLH